jgi:putative peptidoglycan lipid II flippase
MGPATIGVSVAQISLLINTAFASWLPTGSVSWLNYADRLMEFPMGMLGAALGTILLPSLSKKKAEDDAEGFSNILDWGLRIALLLTAPAGIGMMILGVPLAATLFQHGAFGAADTLQTRQALLAYSIGLVGLIMVKILAPAFYSRQDIRTPLKYALISLTATQLMNLLFIFVFHLRHAGLALSISLAATLNATLLYYGLRKARAFTPHTGWLMFFLKLLLALFFMGVTLYFAMGPEQSWFEHGTVWRIVRLSLVMAAGGAVYFVTLILCGFRYQDFHRRT